MTLSRARSTAGGILLILTLGCQGETRLEQQRTRTTQALDYNGNAIPATETTGASGNAEPAPEALGTTTPEPGFSPEDPNTFSRKPGVAFPSVKFELKNTPNGSVDLYVAKPALAADVSISHYAYKLATEPSCDKTGGYTVMESKAPLTLNFESLPMGKLYLCAIAFHFPTKQWQDMTKALVYSWDKIPFKRTIETYYEFYDAQCRQTIKTLATLTLEGDKGNYVWKQEPMRNCQTSPNTFTDLMSMVKVGATEAQGFWHEGPTVAGWFKFTFTNPERTQFKGSWGYGEPGVKSEGVWNSVAQTATPPAP